ncbi:MAG: DNA repair protein RadA [Bacteroidetes bacterium CG18_big_fil_WC_8_21_14_2_50_41_14]|nr:MAG: DNA repair protein RadA [Bacteroidetes bacterium CG18_big_fil_WC_8_21_14_2_50_41_14]PIY31260.1 MAG: DNA repair protein RadA [Bacteroidetes bacterium CG_4_10_14_3_um_filter_42_6]PJB57528.1 MAG: DNA repair protein RadA [Bacteroidetes bacterium CG_4_9_14_3_um_filter_41_19]
MAKAKTMYFCSNCGNASGKWIGKCPACGEWNTFVEEVVSKPSETKPGFVAGKTKSAPIQIHQIVNQREDRIDTMSTEFNRVLGGGLVPGSIVLIGGEPGIGKSTLLLQMAINLKGKKILYLSGEESPQQIKMRADRLKGNNPDCYILNETSTTDLFQHTLELAPDLVIIDSIQTMHTDTIDSTAGSISQIRETAGELQRFAKLSNTPVLLIGHITKDGNLAGPKVLEHMVDAVLQFEGDQHYGFRILRSIKNRYGSTSELGIYEMGAAGLREVTNPSELLLSQREEETSGVAIAAMIEGQRPMLIETQALVGTAVYGTPQRSSTGFDLRRLNMLLAVIEKRSGFRLSTKDVFLNIAGGLRVEDPAIDLAVVAAILSSAEEVAIGHDICFAGEVGLSGEIRAVSRVESRIAEAEKLGFKQIFVSKYGLKGLDIKKLNIEVVPLTRVTELVKKLI